MQVVTIPSLNQYRPSSRHVNCDSIKPFNAKLSAISGPLILQIPQPSVHCTAVNVFKATILYIYTPKP